MKILVVGSGAREHALCKALSKSKERPSIVAFCDTHNAGIAHLSSRIEIGDISDMKHLQKIAQEEKPDFAIIGPESPIAEGAADVLAEIGVPSIAPTKRLARIESSKSFTRKLIHKYEITGNPKYQVFFEEEGMLEFAKECGEIVVKFDGLAGGKGVRVQGDHFSTLEEGLIYAKECIKESGKVLLEEKLVGQEFSLMFFSDGETIVPMPVVQDNKRALVDDEGPNTGGMGSISDANHTLPFLLQKDIDEAKEMTTKVIGALQAECEEKYKGIIFGGFIATKNGVRLVEYNARFGDPEALNILPILASDFVSVCTAILEGNLKKMEVEFYEQATVCKYIVPEGYPVKPVKDVPIVIDDSKIPEEVELFYGNVDVLEGRFLLKGSRAVAVVGIADSLPEAQYLAEEATKAVEGPVFHREDIGTGRLLRKRKEMMDLLRKVQ